MCVSFLHTGSCRLMNRDSFTFSNLNAHYFSCLIALATITSSAMLNRSGGSGTAVVIICIFLMISKVEHFFMYLDHWDYSSDHICESLFLDAIFSPLDQFVYLRPKPHCFN